jgi:glycosyltransferase involved in cell wall biosynthesis
MIRVGFVIAVTDRAWMGGLNYLSNLVHAIHAIPDRDIEPVLIVSPRTPDALLAAFPAVETIRSCVVTEGTPLRKVRKLLERGLGRDLIMEAFLRRHRIDVLSHSDQLGRHAGIPTIGWIPDFQHVRMPEFFDARERAARNRAYNRIVCNCDLVLLSSEDARKDLTTFAPDKVGKSRVLRFVSGLSALTIATTAEQLAARYGLAEPFFYLPNQFWAHKNHVVAIEALGVLTQRGISASIVCTGNTADRRNPGLFGDFQTEIDRTGVREQFRVLGLVPYTDVRGLMEHSVAIINPSRFEGWSTSVEEGKSLGKCVLLSDIPVHREQAPSRGHYFPTDSAARLADLMQNALANYDPERERTFKDEALRSRAVAFQAFGEAYRTIAQGAYSLALVQRRTQPELR